MSELTQQNEEYYRNVALGDPRGSTAELLSEIDELRAKLAKAEHLIRGGLDTDGSHHKQWFLEEIAVALGVDVGEHTEEGIAP